MRMLAIAMMGLLAGLAVAQGAAVPRPKAVAEAKLVCHREEVTGSLAGGRKTCHTRAEWEAQARASQEAAEQMVDRGRITTCTTPGC